MRRSRRTPTLNITSPLSHWVAALEAEHHVNGSLQDIQRSMSLICHQQEFQSMIATEHLDPATLLRLSKLTGKMATAGTSCPASRIMPATEDYTGYTSSLEYLIDKNQNALKKAIKQLNDDFNGWKDSVDKSTDLLKKQIDDALKHLKADPAKSYPSVKVTPASLFGCSYKKITEDGRLRSVDKLYTAVVFAGTDLQTVLGGVLDVIGYVHTVNNENELAVIEAIRAFYTHEHRQYDPFPLHAWTEKKVTVSSATAAGDPHTPNHHKYTLTSNQFPTGQTLVVTMAEDSRMSYAELTSSLSVELVKGDLTRSKEPLFIDAFTNKDLIQLVEYFDKEYLATLWHYQNVVFKHFKIDTDNTDIGYTYLIGFVFETVSKVFSIYRDIITQTLSFINAVTGMGLNGIEKSYISLESTSANKDPESQKSLSEIEKQFDTWFADFKKKIEQIEKEHEEINDELKALSKNGSWLERTFGDKDKIKALEITAPPLFYSTIGGVDKNGVLPSVQKLGSALMWSCMDLQNFIGSCDELFGDIQRKSIKTDEEFESNLKEQFSTIDKVFNFEGWQTKKNPKSGTEDTLYTSSYYPSGKALSFNVCTSGSADKILNSITLISIKMNPPAKQSIHLEDFTSKDLLKITNYMSNHTIDMFRYRTILPDIYKGKHAISYSLKHYVKLLKWMLNVHTVSFTLYCTIQKDTLAFIRQLLNTVQKNE